MDQQDIGIIGFGVVGQNVRRLLFPRARVVDPLRFNIDGSSWHTEDDAGEPVIVDQPGTRRYRVAFVCVPTDPLPDGSADTSIVQQAIRENQADVFVVKSTVPPGTCAEIMRQTGQCVVFSPEFWGGTQHANAVDHDFVILGGERWDTSIVAEAYKEIMPASFRIMKTDSLTAELVKYAENAFLATKVTFFAEWYRVCEAYGVDVDEWRELLLQDSRIGRSHSFAYRGHPYYDSHCLNKDVPAIVMAAQNVGVVMNLLLEVIASNDRHKAAAEFSS